MPQRRTGIAADASSRGATWRTANATTTRGIAQYQPGRDRFLFDRRMLRQRRKLQAIRGLQ
jgi:hypothetical protein